MRNRCSHTNVVLHLEEGKPVGLLDLFREVC